jgi:hypothetical protein
MNFGDFMEKIFFCQFRHIMTPLALKIENFGQNKSSRAEKLAIFVWGIRINWSRDDLPTLQIPGREVFADIVLKPLLKCLVSSFTRQI